MNEASVAALAAEAFDLLGIGRQTTSFSVRDPDLDLAATYHVASVVRELREATGERPVRRCCQPTHGSGVAPVHDHIGVRANCGGLSGRGPV